jgi:hypothetical protein
MEFGRPVPAFDGVHKMQVLVWDEARRKAVVVKFGRLGYTDYLSGASDAQRESYLRRSAGIRRADGSPTVNDVTSASYWARRILWQSGEPWYPAWPR